MTPIFAELEQFKNHKLEDVIDRIDSIAQDHGYTVCVMDDEFPCQNIDVDPMRLNVHLVTVHGIKFVNEFTRG